MPIGYHKSAAVREAADKLYAELAAAGIDVLLEDRDERPGVLFADMDLIGIPHRLVLSRARPRRRHRRVQGPHARRERRGRAARRGARSSCRSKFAAA